MHFILLLGPSSAGKSTLCNELKDWTIISGDIIWLKMQDEARPDLIQKYKNQGLTDILCPPMTEDDLVKVCNTGELNINGHKLRFSDSSYPEAEEHLKTAGIDDAKIPEMAKALRAVGSLYQPPKLMERLCEEAFQLGTDPDAKIIIDMVPGDSPEETVSDIQMYEKRAAEFAGANQTTSVNSQTVLAYCHPVALSNRIEARNLKNANKPEEIRKGLTAFMQVACLVEAQPKMTPVELQLAAQVRNRNSPQNENLGMISHADIVTIVQKNGKSESSERDTETLAKAFGVTPNSGSTELRLRDGIKFDATIDLGVGTPEQNAQKLVDLTNQKTNTLTNFS